MFGNLLSRVRENLYTRCRVAQPELYDFREILEYPKRVLRFLVPLVFIFTTGFEIVEKHELVRATPALWPTREAPQLDFGPIETSKINIFPKVPNRCFS